jgi:hypothetical protein
MGFSGCRTRLIDSRLAGSPVKQRSDPLCNHQSVTRQGDDDVSAAWPDIPYEPWRETCSALHLYLQIAGKYRLARTPWINHSWHATFYVTARGFTTSTFLMVREVLRSSSISSTMW